MQCWEAQKTGFPAGGNSQTLFGIRHDDFKVGHGGHVGDHLSVTLELFDNDGNMIASHTREVPIRQPL